MARTVAKARRERDSYLELVKKVPVKKIHDEERYEAALAMVQKLTVRGDEQLDRGEMDYLEVLAGVVAEYEAKRHDIDLSGLGPVDVLKHLMEAGDLKTADVARIVGSPSLASMIL